ncbi:hypothetical protein MAXJ12_24767 [Mesorhizobium alhagi CCNWXJ12-2]|uniref:Uncharacterized protein n=1 Tax=Mesorhizobium alhagi CCNWXJ12-2 TaxID=1107882 RepID=H0HXQ4_9HYPH|nr:hypothetical protein MAXJ12_24767 [Mesorhizobium alhagi CCNWXJ12-2]
MRGSPNGRTCPLSRNLPTVSRAAILFEARTEIEGVQHPSLS